MFKGVKEKLKKLDNGFYNINSIEYYIYDNNIYFTNEYHNEL